MTAFLRQWLPVAVLLSLAATGWWYFLDFESLDSHFFRGWLNHIRRYGLAHAYGHAFSNYAPLYIYLIGISDLFFPLQSLYAIKFLTLAGDIAMAGLVYHIVKKHGRSGAVPPVIAACLFLASPSVIVNGASAAQCDIFYSLFLVATMYSLYLERPAGALVCYGIAIAFKLQAIFLSPFILIFLLKRKIPLHLFWVPAAVYMVTILPCWLEGRDLVGLLTIYWGQFNSFGDLGNAGNFHYLLSRYFPKDFILMRDIAIATTIYSAIMYAFITSMRWNDKKVLFEYVLLANFCVALMPFILPQMLDRYFFPAEIFALLLACLRPCLLPITLLFQAATMLVYPDSQFALTNRVLGWSFDMRHATAATLDLTAILWLGVLCWRHIWRRDPARLD